MAGKPNSRHIEVARAFLNVPRAGTDVYDQMFALGFARVLETDDRVSVDSPRGLTKKQKRFLDAKRNEGKQVTIDAEEFIRTRADQPSLTLGPALSRPGSNRGSWSQGGAVDAPFQRSARFLWQRSAYAYEVGHAQELVVVPAWRSICGAGRGSRPSVDVEPPGRSWIAATPWPGFHLPKTEIAHHACRSQENVQPSPIATRCLAHRL